MRLEVEKQLSLQESIEFTMVGKGEGDKDSFVLENGNQIQQLEFLRAKLVEKVKKYYKIKKKGLILVNRN